MPFYSARRNRFSPFIAATLLLVSAAPGQASTPEVPKSKKATSVAAVLDPATARTVADKQITQAQLRDYLTFIASDEMEGRDTPSRGLNTVAKFIAFNLARWGVKPMG